MSHIQPNQLKELRVACGVTVIKAAISVGVKERTWRTYETCENNASHVDIPKFRLKAFCDKQGLPYPPVTPDGQILKKPNCKVLSITTYKGGWKIGHHSRGRRRSCIDRSKGGNRL